MKKKYTIGFIGCGHMGMAIARGAVVSEYVERYQVCVYDPVASIREICRQESFAVMADETAVAENSHIVLIAVKPQEMDALLARLKNTAMDCVVSIVTGVSVAHIQEQLGNVPVIRAMPNTPLQINEGATALCMSSNCKADDYDFVYKLFDSMGVTRSIPESRMNDIIAVHGSTPAYVYYFIECLMKDAAARGIDEDAARDLIVQTFIGSATLLKKNRTKPVSDFIDEVCSKGGTTIEAITELKRQNLDRILHDANERCIARAEELGK
jgi:pyrroline-5-carboxylate reductase